MTTPDILILGGDGMLGHKIFQRLRSSALAMCTLRGDSPPRVDLLAGADVIHGVDLIDLDRTAELLAGLRPRFVINCAGIVKQRAQAGDAIPTITINSLQGLTFRDGRLRIHPQSCDNSGREALYDDH